MNHSTWPGVPGTVTPRARVSRKCQKALLRWCECSNELRRRLRRVLKRRSITTCRRGTVVTLKADGPVAGFSGDTPRLSVEARSQFAVGLDDLITILAGLIAESPSNPGKPDRRTLREQAISLCSQMVGALVLSRAVAEPASALADEVLESSRRDLLAHFRKS